MITDGSGPVGVEQPKLPLALVNVVPADPPTVSTMVTGLTEAAVPMLETLITQKIAVGPWAGSSWQVLVTFRSGAFLLLPGTLMEVQMLVLFAGLGSPAVPGF